MITRISAHARFVAFTLFVLLPLHAFSQDSIKAKADTLILNGFVLDRNDFDQIHILKANSGLQYYMQLQPGIKTILNPTSEIVNGSSWSDNAFYIEGLPVRYLFDIYGISILSERMIDQLTFQTLNYSPERTGISSVSDISLFYGNEDRMKTFYSQSLFVSDINLNGPLGKNTRFNADLRFMPFGLLPIFASSPIPEINYRYNFNLALESRINTKNSIKVFFGNNPYGTLIEQSYGTADTRLINRFYGLRWKHSFSKTSYAEIMLGKSRYISSVLLEYPDPGMVQKESLNIDDYIADINVCSKSLRYNRTTLGLRMDINQILHQNFISKEGEPDSITTEKDQRYTDIFLYVRDQINWKNFSASLGFRAGLYHKEAFQDLYFHPQLNLALELSKGFSVIGDVSYNTANAQYISSQTGDSFYSYSDLVNQKSSLKYQFGLLSNMFSGMLSAECLVFYYETDHSIENYRWEFEPEPVEIASVANNSWSQYYGINARIRKHTGKFTAWLSASIAEKIQQIVGVNENEPFSPFDFTKGIFSGYSNYSFNDKYSVGISATYCIGREYSYTRYYLDGGAVGMRAQIPSILKGGIHFSYLRKKEKSIQNFYFALGPTISFKYSLSL